MELSNNYSSIFTGLSNYFTLTQRSYAGWRNFYLKKIKKFVAITWHQRAMEKWMFTMHWWNFMGYKIYIQSVKRYKKFMKCFFLRTKYDIIKTIQIGEWSMEKKDLLANYAA